jgi:hypothetical protein
MYMQFTKIKIGSVVENTFLCDDINSFKQHITKLKISLIISKCW